MFPFPRLVLSPRFCQRGLSLTRGLSSSRIVFNKLGLNDLESSKPNLSVDPPKIDKARTRSDMIIDKLPKSIRKYGSRLVNAPIPHVVSFLTIHEMTAVLPFLGLWYAFHSYGFLPTDLPSWVLVKGTGMIENILGDSVASWSIQDRTKLVVEGATAYGIVKAFFIPRVLFSLFLTPWVARVIVEPLFGFMARLLGKKRVDSSYSTPQNELGELGPEIKLKKDKKKPKNLE